MGSDVPGDVAIREQAWGNHVNHGGVAGEVASLEEEDRLRMPH